MRGTGRSVRAAFGAGDSELLAGEFQDVTAIYATRSELMSNFPPHTLFDDATSIRACGLSLNLICQQYGVHGLQRVSSSLTCRPAGDRFADVRGGRRGGDGPGG